METRKKLTLVIVLILLLLLPFVILIARQRQDIRNRAAAPAAADRVIDIVLDPSSGNRTSSQTFEVNLKIVPVPNVTYTPLPANILVVGAEAEINVSDKLIVNNNTTDPAAIVGTVACLEPFRGAKYKKVEGQKVTVECTLEAGTTLPLTAGGRVFAKLNLTVKSDAATGGAPLTFVRTRVTRGDIPNQSPDVSTSGQNATFTITDLSATVTPSPTLAPTATPGGPTATPSPTPLGGGEGIDIGTKNSLTINISGGPTPTGGGPTPTIDPTIPQVKFKVALLAQNTPEIKVRLKVTDLLAQITPGAQPADTCQASGPGMYYYKDIPMIYGGSDITIGEVAYRIYQLKNGWLPLTGTTAGRIYSLAVKGEKHRSVAMVTNFTLNSGQPLTQEFDWTAKPLETGDLPDPNNSNYQDCTVNSIDLSLIESRQAQTNQADLDVADVNYDGVVNGNDTSKVVNTLSTKPDDD